MDLYLAQEQCRQIVSGVSRYFVVDDEAMMQKVLCGILAGGHILFEDNPGLGKTLLVKTFAKSMGCHWNRIQFTPDLMPADIVGTRIWKRESSTFELERGPIFTNLLLADEINRAMPKTQSALLEAMEEHQVTIEGVTHRLPPPFTVMATQNPIENEGTYPLPEAQMDRFILRLSLGYVSSLDKECEILRRRINWQQDDPTESIPSAISQNELVQLQRDVEEVYVDENILRYISEITRATRANPKLRVGASPRGSLALLKLARASALINGRLYVIPDDVKGLAVHALAHRVVLDLDYSLDGLRPEKIIEGIVEGTDVPKEIRTRALA